MVWPSWAWTRHRPHLLPPAKSAHPSCLDLNRPPSLSFHHATAEFDPQLAPLLAFFSTLLFEVSTSVHSFHSTYASPPADPVVASPLSPSIPFSRIFRNFRSFSNTTKPPNTTIRILSRRPCCPCVLSDPRFLWPGAAFDISWIPASPITKTSTRIKPRLRFPVTPFTGDCSTPRSSFTAASDDPQDLTIDRSVSLTDPPRNNSSAALLPQLALSKQNSAFLA